MKSSKNKQAKRIGYFILIISLLTAIYLMEFNKRPEISKKADYHSLYNFKKQGELSFFDNEGNLLSKIDIELADTDEKREQGLMFRTEMNENCGMLFIFPTEEYQSFWMKNTSISLDILFVNKNKEIVTIHRHTKTMSDQSYPSSEPSIYVVEVNAGYCDKYGITEGCKIDWRETITK